MSYRICLDKENFKFSSSHFTIFAADRAERLHGHNYYLSCEIGLGELDSELGIGFEFKDLKDLIKKTVDELDEYILIPERSNLLRIEHTPPNVELVFGHKRYMFPDEDVRLLPLTNITSELLACYLGERLAAELKKLNQFSRIQSLAIGIEETRGQKVVYELGFS